MFKKTCRCSKSQTHERRQIRNGSIYHHHHGEIVVSKRELLLQLSDMGKQDNLLKLLMFGKSLPDYETRLTKAALKFEFIGSLCYPFDKDRTKKPATRVYIKHLFQGSYETANEAKSQIEHLAEAPVTDEYATAVFRKLLFVIYTCCPCMADTCEMWWGNTYRHLIEYAIDHSDFPLPDCENIWDAYPADMPLHGNNRSYVFKRFSLSLAEKINESYKTWEHFRS